MALRRGTVAVLGLLLVVLAAALPATTRAAVSVPAGFSETTYASGFAGRLTAMVWSPDGRLFVSEKTGALRVVKQGRLLPTPFLRLSVNSNSERGLLGVAFDPNFTTTRYVYAYYTTPAGKNRVSRFRASATNPDLVETGSEKVLLDNIPSDAGFHNGGAVHFGNDGKLYISVGDSGNGPNAQDLGILAGKLLRINSDGTIPADNPFVGQAGKRAEIWAYGLRNPYTMAFKPGTSTLFINDVGNNKWEEIDRGTRGANYGWPVCEGVCQRAGFTDPIYTYSHASGPGKAIVGGTFYTANKFPAAYSGDYFFADYVGGYIKTYDPTTGAVTGFATGIPSPVDLRVGPDGALYFLSVDDHIVGRITYGSSGPTPTPTRTPSPTPPTGHAPVPTITTPAAGTTYRAGDVISFSGGATDAEDGTLAASHLTWEVVFHHDTHTHPFLEPVSGITHGTFTIPTSGEASANTWYRIHLRATDSNGNTTELTRDIHPRTATVTLATSPSGLEVELDGTPTTTPSSFVGVQGFIRRVAAPATQVRSGVTYQFVSWSDGGARDHTFATPTASTTITATYRVADPTGTTLARDGFGRTTSGGWGSADIGGPWATLGQKAAFGVSSGTGTFTLNGSKSTAVALLTSSNVRDVDVRVRVSVSARAANGRFYVYLVTRADATNEYRPKIIFEANGTISIHAGVVIAGVESPLGGSSVASGLTYTAGQSFWVRTQVTGSSPTTIRVKIWRDGAAEPSNWQFTATDSHSALQDAGQLGLRAYISSHSSNAGVAIRFDDYLAIPAN